MPTSDPGSSAAPRHQPAGEARPHRSPSCPRQRPSRGARISARRHARGFTLIEIMVVLAIVAIATAVASLALRDPAGSKLEQEAARLASLLESARAEARASGVAARWEPLADQADGSGFRFVGLPAGDPMPTQWMEPGTSAQVIGARAVVLGPEPLIGAQRIALRLGDHRLTLATDGIGPFVVSDSDGPR